MAEITFRVKRQDPADKKNPEAHWEEYTVPYEGNLTVLEGLFYIQEKLRRQPLLPVLLPGVHLRQLRHVHQRRLPAGLPDQRQAPGHRPRRRAVVTVSPMPHLPVVKDLVVDMDDFFAKYEYIKPWLIRNSQDPEKEILQSPKDRKKIDMPIDCILCGCCYSSCPSVWGEENYIGPAALLKAYRFEVDSRDEARKERMPLWDNERGVYRCHTIMNCQEACPKELSPTEGIQWLKKAAVRRRLFGRVK